MQNSKQSIQTFPIQTFPLHETLNLMPQPIQECSHRQARKTQAGATKLSLCSVQHCIPPELLLDKKGLQKQTAEFKVGK